MTVEQIGRTNYANIYGIYSPAGEVVGTAEIVLAGRYAGKYFYTLSGKYTRKQIEKIFYSARRETA